MITCQVALYPLGADQYGEAINEALDVLATGPVKMQVGPMSTLLWGEAGAVWSAARSLFEAATRDGHTAVLTMTVSNACAVPEA